MSIFKSHNLNLLTGVHEYYTCHGSRRLIFKLLTLDIHESSLMLALLIILS